jgi:hypothetical protein
MKKIFLLLVFFPYFVFSQSFVSKGSEIIYIQPASTFSSVGGVKMAGSAANTMSLPQGVSLYNVAPATRQVLMENSTSKYEVRDVAINTTANFYMDVLVATNRTKADVAVVNKNTTKTYNASLTQMNHPFYTAIPLQWTLSSADAVAADVHDLTFSWGESLETTQITNKRLYVYNTTLGVWKSLPAANTVIDESTNVLTYTGYTGALQNTKFMIANAQKSIAATDITVAALADVNYNGLSQNLEPIVKEGTTVLTKDQDYTLTYSNNKNVGTATITINGAGNYGLTRTITFVIKAVPLSIVADNKTKVFGEVDPILTVSYSGFVNNETAGANLTGTLAVTRIAGENVGSYAITAAGYTSANYTISYTAGTFSITAKSVSDLAVDPISPVTYNGVVQNVLPVIKNGTTLVNNTNYSLSYANNKNAGTATITITGTGNYSGTRTTNFSINPAPLAVAVDWTTKVFATVDPTFTATTTGYVNGDSSSVLTGTIAFTRFPGENVGGYAITASGLSAPNYAITYSAGFLNITRKSVSTDITVNPMAGVLYSGLSQTPTPVVQYGSKTLLANTDYTITKYINNINAGEATITITGAGNYIDEKTVNFSINKAALTVTANDTFKMTGRTEPAYSVSYSGFVNNETQSNLNGTLAFTRQTGETAGTYAVTPRGYATSNNYNFTYVNGTLTIIGTTTWDGTAWSHGSPDSAIEAIIAGAYNSKTVGNGFSAKKVSINEAASLILSSPHSLTVTNEVINNAGENNLVIESGANLIQISDVLNTGNAVVKRDSNPLFRLDYTLWSSPVSNPNAYLAPFSPFTSNAGELNIRFYTYNALTNLYNSVKNAASTPFSLGKGYLIRMPNENPTSLGTGSTYFKGTTQLVFKGQFTGVLNNGTISLTGLEGGTYNAIGNPYPSAIDATKFINSNTGIGTLYFWRNKNSTNGGSSYATYTLAGEVANGGYTPSGSIAVGQGFITTAPTSGTITFTNAMRTANTATFLRTTSKSEKDKIWINLSKGKDAVNQILIAYMAGATTGVDMGIDGKYINDSPIALTSDIDNEEYVIQGRPEFTDADVVSLNFKTNVAGDYTIAKDKVEGLFDKGQSVFLVDALTGIETNLQSTAYIFTTAVGTFNNRFKLTYKTASTLGLDDLTTNENAIYVYKQNGALHINAGTAIIKNVKVFDLSGQLIAEQKTVNSTTTTIKNLIIAEQTLLIQVTTDTNKVVTKKVIY